VTKAGDPVFSEAEELYRVNGDLESMTDDVPKIPIVCPVCETRAKIPFSNVEETVTDHNERLHDGDPVAAVDPDVFDHLADQVAVDLGLLEG
jgi:hypothetical protein